MDRKCFVGVLRLLCIDCDWMRKICRKWVGRRTESDQAADGI